MATGLHARNRGLTTCPLSLSTCNFRRQNQHELELGAFGKLRIRIEEDAPGIEIASLAGGAAFRELDLDLGAHGNAAIGATLRFGSSHGSLPPRVPKKDL